MEHLLFGTEFFVVLFCELSGKNKVKEIGKSRENDVSNFRNMLFKVGHSKKENVLLRIGRREYY